MAPVRHAISDAWHWLRVPLILAMAVGLYANAPEKIPSSIGALYKKMVEEMLSRHSFATNPSDANRAAGHTARHSGRDQDGTRSPYSLNKFEVFDKYSFLRQFALEAASPQVNSDKAPGQPGGAASQPEAVSLEGNFDKFTRQSLEAFAGQCADRLNMKLDDADCPDAFVGEIITHSGLLAIADGDDCWRYAHRSIQEFLAAQELREDSNGDFLLKRADIVSWSQAIQFYVVGQEAKQVDPFLCALAKQNPVLAVRCLQACRPSVSAATEVLDRLCADTREAVTALAAATHCPQNDVRLRAIAKLREAIEDPDGVFSRSSFQINDLLPLIDSLTRTNAAASCRSHSARPPSSSPTSPLPGS